MLLAATAFLKMGGNLHLEERTLLHYSPIHDECQNESPYVLALPFSRGNQNDSHDTPHSMCEFQAYLLLLWIKAYPGISKSILKGN